MKIGHLSGRISNKEKVHTWSRRQVVQFDREFVRYAMFDSTSGRTAAKFVMCGSDSDRREIARTLMRARMDLKRFVSSGGAAA